MILRKQAGFSGHDLYIEVRYKIFIGDQGAGSDVFVFAPLFFNLSSVVPACGRDNVTCRYEGNTGNCREQLATFL